MKHESVLLPVKDSSETILESLIFARPFSIDFQISSLLFALGFLLLALLLLLLPVHDH